MHNAAFADHMERWDQLTGGVPEDASDAAFLQPQQESLIRARAEVWEAKQRQLHHRAARAAVDSRRAGERLPRQFKLL